MIKSIASSSSFIQVSGGSTASPYISPGATSAGMLRYNPNTQSIEVYDGVAWLALSNSYADISLSMEADSLLRWVRDHRIKIEEEEKLRNDHPAVKNAWEQYQVIKTLSQKEKENV